LLERGRSTEASMIFADAALVMLVEVTFRAAGGLLTYWVLQPERIVVLLDLSLAA
jgi:hypothetical protein